MSHGSTQKDATSSLLDDQRLTSPNRSETTILPDDTNENNNLQQQHSVSTDGNEMFEMTQTDQQHTEYRDNATSCNTTNGTIKSKNRVDQLKESDPQSDSRPDSVSSFTNDGENNQNSPHSENKNQDGDINPRGSVRFSSRRLSSRASCRSHRGLAPIKKESSIDDVKEPEVRNISSNRFVVMWYDCSKEFEDLITFFRMLFLIEFYSFKSIDGFQCCFFFTCISAQGKRTQNPSASFGGKKST